MHGVEAGGRHGCPIVLARLVEHIQVRYLLSNASCNGVTKCNNHVGDEEGLLTVASYDFTKLLLSDVKASSGAALNRNGVG